MERNGLGARRSVVGVLVLAVLGIVGSAPANVAAQERAPGVQRARYVIEVDPARVREVGWVEAEADDAAAVTSAAAVVRRRLDAMERSFELTVDVEGRRLELAMPSIVKRERSLFTEMLDSLGTGEFLMVADETNVAELGLDLARERAKLDAWHEQNPTRPLAAFDALAPEEGPPLRLQWLETQFGDTTGPPMPVLLPERPEEHFGASAFAHTSAALDALGYPALQVDFTDERAKDLESFSEARKDQRLAIVFDGRVRSAPTLNDKLIGGAIIEGRFLDGEVKRLAELLEKHEGPLKVLEVK